MNKTPRAATKREPKGLAERVERSDAVWFLRRESVGSVEILVPELRPDQ